MVLSERILNQISSEYKYGALFTVANILYKIIRLNMAEEKFNQDELVPPSFVNEAYIVDILRQVEDDPELHVIKKNLS